MSIFDHPDSVQPAPSWRCPECRTLQPETTRCWRCDKPAFTCESCSYYRASVAADLGTCLNDPARAPLSAHEIRSCWESAGMAGLGTAGSVVVSAPGLFDEAEIAPPAPPEPAAAGSAAPGVRAATERTRRRRLKPPLEAPGRAAWAEPEGDALVDAPVVEPEKRLSTEVQRRRRRWFR